MKEGWANLARIVGAAFLTATMTLTLAWGLNAVVGDSQRKLANRVDQNAAATVRLVQKIAEQRDHQYDDLLWVVCRIAERDGLTPPVCQEG